MRELILILNIFFRRMHNHGDTEDTVEKVINKNFLRASVSPWLFFDEVKQSGNSKRITLRNIKRNFKTFIGISQDKLSSLFSHKLKVGADGGDAVQYYFL